MSNDSERRGIWAHPVTKVGRCIWGWMFIVHFSSQVIFVTGCGEAVSDAWNGGDGRARPYPAGTLCFLNREIPPAANRYARSLTPGGQKKVYEPMVVVMEGRVGARNACETRTAPLVHCSSLTDRYLLLPTNTFDH